MTQSPIDVLVDLAEVALSSHTHRHDQIAALSLMGSEFLPRRGSFDQRYHCPPPILGPCAVIERGVNRFWSEPSGFIEASSARVEVEMSVTSSPDCVVALV